MSSIYKTLLKDIQKMADETKKTFKYFDLLSGKVKTIKARRKK